VREVIASTKPGAIQYGLTWEAVDLQEACIYVTEQQKDDGFGPAKTESAARRVPLTAGALEQLREHMKVCPATPENLVFPMPSGKPVDSSNFNKRVWYPTRKAAGIPPKTRLYDLRGTFASALVRSGRSMAYLQYVMGHKDARTTMKHYVGVFSEETQVAVIDLQEWLDGPKKKRKTPARSTSRVTPHKTARGHGRGNVVPFVRKRKAGEGIAPPPTSEDYGGMYGTRTRDLWLDRPAL